MKAISLWQPWATLIALGLKTVETRSWRMDYRGPLVICSTTGKSQNERAFGDYSSGRYAILTTNCRRFAEPFPVKGKQKLFEVELPKRLEYAV